MMGMPPAACDSTDATWAWSDDIATSEPSTATTQRVADNFSFFI
jgi:hypothetical protein